MYGVHHNSSSSEVVRGELEKLGRQGGSGSRV